MCRKAAFPFSDFVSREVKNFERLVGLDKTRAALRMRRRYFVTTRAPAKRSCRA